MSTSSEQSVIDALKRASADVAAAQLRDGMIVGLGSGSTARFAVEAIAKRVKAGLRIIGIPTSEQTASLAAEGGIVLATLGEHSRIDVTIDGADEVELGTLHLIKGGGGNQLREKIVATASERLVIIVDERKLVPKLGTRAPVPVEVAQFGWQATSRHLTEKRASPVLRLTPDGQPYVTDGGNYILDCAFGPIEDPGALQGELDALVGVMEHGLFVGMTSQVLIGTGEGVKQLGGEASR